MRSLLFLCVLLVYAGDISGQTIRLGSGSQDKDQLLIIRKDGLSMLIDSKGNIQDKGFPFVKDANTRSIDYDIHGRVRQIGEDRIEYDIHGQVRKGGMDNYFLLFKLIEKYNGK